VATQKQRRKRAKEKRHEYELVEIDSEGNETVLRASELKPDTGGKAATTAKSGPKRGADAKTSARRGRGTPQPPSWQRVLKRGALFAPIFLATVLLLSGDRLTFAGAVVQTILLLAFFVPVSYLMDRLVWRSYEKRLARSK
jgi:hypothetical protein